MSHSHMNLLSCIKWTFFLRTVKGKKRERGRVLFRCATAGDKIADNDEYFHSFTLYFHIEFHRIATIINPKTKLYLILYYYIAYQLQSYAISYGLIFHVCVLPPKNLLSEIWAGILGNVPKKIIALHALIAWSRTTQNTFWSEK